MNGKMNELIKIAIEHVKENGGSITLDFTGMFPITISYKQDGVIIQM